MAWVVSTCIGLSVALGAPAAWAAPDPSPPVTYADGLVLSLASIEIMPSTDAATCTDAGVCRPGETADDRLVRVTVSLTLPAGAASALPLDVVAGTASGIGLRIGARFGDAGSRPAAIDCGSVAETEILCTDIAASVPTYLPPGGAVRLCESFDVPVRGLDALAITVQPPVSDAAGTNPLSRATFVWPHR